MIDINSFLLDSLEGRNDMDFITRFNGGRTINKESVSQHSYWVTLFAGLLIQGMPVFELGVLKNFKYNILMSCLLHDYDETYTGDILYTFKHHPDNSKEIKSAIDNFIEVKGFDDELIYISKLMEKSEVFRDDDDYEIPLLKCIKKTCDWLSMIKYANQEISLGNSNMKVILESAKIHAIACLFGVKDILQKSMSKHSMKGYTESISFLDNIINKLKNQ